MNRTRIATASLTVLALLSAGGWLLNVYVFAQTKGGTAPDPAHGGLADLGARALDLTYSFDERTIYWPTDKSFQWEKTKWGPSPGGYWYASATYAASEHGGTHLDSPIHFGEAQATVDEIPLSRLIGPAVVIDCSASAARDRDYRLSAADLDAWEKAHGTIPSGAIVLVRTGWGRFWPDKKQYLGSDVHGDTAHLTFPGIGRDAAQWLATNRKIAGVGIDTASLDHGRSLDFIAHRVLNGAGIYGIENVANLDRVPVLGATAIALPMKIKGGSGGPVRLIVLLPQALNP